MGKSKTDVVESKPKKAVKIVLDVILYLFLAVCLFGVIVTIASKKDADGTANIFGRQVRFVQSSSMEKCDQTDVSDFKIKDIPVKSLVFIKTVPKDDDKAAEWYASLKVGDVLTFKYVYGKQETITHRIVEIIPKEDGSGYVITLEGDNKAADGGNLTQTIDTSLTDSPNYIIGKVTATSYFLGLFAYALKTPVGIVCIIIIPCFIVIAFEVIRIISAIHADKNKAEKEKEEAQKNELEELKRKLAALEGTEKADMPATEKTDLPATENAHDGEEAEKAEINGEIE